jgi:hypothetical protein
MLANMLYVHDVAFNNGMILSFLIDVTGEKAQGVVVL